MEDSLLNGSLNVSFPSEMVVRLADDVFVHENYKDDLTLKIALQLYTYADFDKITNPAEYAKTCLIRANYFVKAYDELVGNKLPSPTRTPIKSENNVQNNGLKPNIPGSGTNNDNNSLDGSDSNDGTNQPDGNEGTTQPGGNEDTNQPNGNGGTTQPDNNNPTNYEYLLNISICTDIEDETYIYIENANYKEVQSALELEIENNEDNSELFYLFNGNDVDYNNSYNIAIRKVEFDDLFGNIEDITESKQLSLNVYWKRIDAHWKFDDRTDTDKYSIPEYTIDAIKLNNDSSFDDGLDDTIDDNITNSDS